MGGVLQHKVTIQWSPEFAYAIGVLSSDGCLSSDGRHISLKSADLDFVQTFKKILCLENKISTPRGRVRTHYQIIFGDKVFYQFLLGIGLSPAKSKTIKAVEIPNIYFPDFLRGLFDGDGTFYSFWDKRWPSSLVFQIAFASASRTFIAWLKQRLTELYGVRGFIKQGDGVQNLGYFKNDSRKLIQIMYYREGLPCLNRKLQKIGACLQKDIVLFSHRHTKSRAEIAQLVERQPKLFGPFNGNIEMQTG